MNHFKTVTAKLIEVGSDEDLDGNEIICATLVLRSREDAKRLAQCLYGDVTLMPVAKVSP